MQFFGKSLEYWAVMCGMAIYVATRDAERESIGVRIGKTLMSALLAFGLAPSLAVWLSGSEMFATVAIMAFGQILLDVATAIARDKDFIKSLVQKRMGGGDE